MRVLILRHGQTTSNVLGLLDSRVPGPDLTDLGRRQAAAVPGALHTSRVVSITGSDMIRTVQTAEPLAADRGLVIAQDGGFREIEAGDLEMTSGADALAEYAAVAWRWGAGDLDPRLPGGGDGHEFFARYDESMARLRAEADELAVVVSHGASIRVWVGARCADLSPTFTADMALHNTGTALVEREHDGSWRLLEWNAAPIGGEHLHGVSGPGQQDPTGTLTEDQPA